MAKEVKRKNENNNENGRTQYFNLDAEKAFFEEVDEEVRNERFKELINKYGGYILAVLIIALSVAVGYERIAQWQISKAEQKNVQYVQALAPSPDYESNIAALENIVATEKGLYRDMAYLQIASLLLENNQTEKGLDVLNTIHQDSTVTDKVREIAAVKLATYKVDTADYQEIATLLNPIVQKNGAWTVMAKELMAMSAIQNKDMDKARAIYEELLANTNISDEFKARINDMLASINEAQ